MTVTTIVVPTHSHGPTLRLSVGSALAQTVADLDVLLVGDGATDETRAVAGELEHGDPRVRFLDLPKGERHGERNRHVALEQARGRVVCYLADDDLWLPEHVAHMVELLEAADFAAAVRVMVHPTGEHEVERIDLAVPYVRERILTGNTNVPLSCVAHTLRVYRELPFGWRPAPEDISPTLYMWQQFMAHSTCRAVAGTSVTSINYPDVWRPDWTLEERVGEIAPAAARLADPVFRAELMERALRSALYKQAHAEGHLHDIGHHVEHLEAKIDSLEARGADGRIGMPRRLARRVRRR